MKSYFAKPMPAERYRLMTIVAWWAQALIIITGAAVRLTDSGLGCENWPTCTEDRILPEMSYHAAIEFGNRMLSGFVAATVIAVIVGVSRLETRRRDLEILVWGLLIGVVGQIVLGRFVVSLDLNPVSVIGHFMLSVALLWLATRLVVGTNPTRRSPSAPSPDRLTRLLSRAVVGVGLAVITLGTLVTGTGPNGGDVRADRLPFDLVSIVRIHAISAWILVATVTALAIKLQQSPGPMLARRGRLLLLLVLVQGSIGYIQYWKGVHPGLVIFHIAGAIGVWTLCVATEAEVNHKGLSETTPNTVSNGSKVDTIGL